MRPVCRALPALLLPALAFAAHAQDCLPSQPLSPPGSSGPLDDFGSAVEVKDGQVLVGQSYIDSSFGSASIRDLATGAIVAELQPSDPGLGERVGESVAINGDTASNGLSIHGE